MKLRKKELIDEILKLHKQEYELEKKSLYNKKALEEETVEVLRENLRDLKENINYISSE